MQKELAKAEQLYRNAVDRQQQIMAAIETAKSDKKKAQDGLQDAWQTFTRVRAGVYLGTAFVDELEPLERKLEQVDQYRRDLEVLPNVLALLDEKLKAAYVEVSRAQKELDILTTAKEYPRLLKEFVQAGRDDQRELGRLNALAAQIGKGEEVRRLAAEIREHCQGPLFKEPFTFTPDD